MVKIENSRVNVKARIDRHLRIVKDNIWNKKSNISRTSPNSHVFLVLFFLIFIFPIYPTLASFVYNNSSYDFYRWDIDESSIIESYFSGDEEWLWNENIPMLESNDSFLSVNTILDDERDFSGTNEILNYEVKPWDSFSSIAYEFKVSTSSILWANDFSKKHILRPWEILKVPPVSWLIHQVKTWDSFWSIAKKYDIEEIKIKEQNLLSKNDLLNIWDVLVIPWAIKKAPVYKTPPKTYNKTTKTWWYTFANYAGSQYTTNKWSFKLVRREPQHKFYWWNCTWYVGQYKNVNWWWNANAWIKNATAKWHATWTVAKLWSIIQFSGRGYNPRYGHVWIVMEVKPTYVLVSDMNYRRLNEITYRKIPINDRSIDWYIYVN